MKTVELNVDGNQWCATFSDFQNLQESPAGFSDSEVDAVKDLLLQAPMHCTHPMWWGDGMPAGRCNEVAYGPSEIMRHRMYYLSNEIAKCERHGGPSASTAAIHLKSFSAGLFPNGIGEAAKHFS